MIKSFVDDPKKVFFFDGIGALITFFLLSVVLFNNVEIFGFPQKPLYVLSVMPLFFFFYDVYCYFKKKDFIFLIRALALMNLSYCIVSIFIALYHFEKITILGWCYIIIELSVIVAISFFENKISQKLIDS